MHSPRRSLSSHRQFKLSSRKVLYLPANLAIVFAIAFSLLLLNSGTSLAELPSPPIFSLPQETVFDGENHIEVPHDPIFQLAQGTFGLRFTADDVARRQGLFSKDFGGNRLGGDITAYIEHGRVKVRLQSAAEQVYAQTPEGSLLPGQPYHLTVTFGPDGLWVYLNGEIMAAQYRFTQDLTQNTQNMAIGANTWSRSDDHPDATWDHFVGRISDFTVFDVQFNNAQARELAGDLADPVPTAPFIRNNWLIGTDADETLKASDHAGVFNVHGGYGDDVVEGTDDNNFLYGGHGEDVVDGLAGDDIIYSYADGREPIIAQRYGPEDDPDGEINQATKTYYPYQPIEADDVFTGGPGADIFHFRVLINAKRHIILKHVRSDGSINWNGVAGENNRVHDHWVDGIGDEVVTDFNRAEGDRIEIVGHTVQVYKVVHEDSDGDGIVDSTVLHLWSNQGSNGGAHNKDLLGTIRFFGDLVMESDYTVEQKNYGIVPSIKELDEAVTPRVYTPVANDGTPPPFPSVDDGDLPDGAIFGVLNQQSFDGEGHIEIAHHPMFELPAGTFSLRFSANDVARKQGLFSKDFGGNRLGGDITAYIEHGRVKVRLQNATDSFYAQTPEGSLMPGHEYHLAVTFGPGGLWVYLNGKIMAAKPGLTQSLEMNTQNMAIGANTWSRSDDHPYHTWDHFVGVMSEFMIFDTQYTDAQVEQLAGNLADPLPTVPYVNDGWLFGTDDDETLKASDYTDVNNVHGSYGDDIVEGTDLNNILYGGHGEDIVNGLAGDDYIYSFADGREPVIAQRYGPEDDPRNEIDPNTRTYYKYQPIEADDVFTGGPGADTFHFRVLINAKRHIILKHVKSDGSINWNGVAGENNRVHDHWVDGIGDEVVTDFNRAEGDRIEITGHTVEVYKVVHEDSDGDGIVDSTVLHLWSNQGSNGGAHNKDLLGTIRFFGDLVMESDYTVKQTNYGIVDTIAQLDEAVTPRVYTSVANDGTPPPLPHVDDGDLPAGAVFGACMLNTVQFNDEDYLEIAHDPIFELSEGTISLRFNAEDTGRKQGLFSKDYTGNRQGGDLTAYIEYSQVKVRFQSATDDVWVKTAEGSITPGQEYHLAVTFGSEGLWVYLNGQLAAVNLEFREGLQNNDRNMAIGANTWARTDERPYSTWDHFRGTISEFMIFNSQFDDDDVALLAGGQPVPGAGDPGNGETPVLSVQDVRAKATNVISVPVTLSQAPNGLSGFDFEVSISDENIATITGVEVADQFIEIDLGQTNSSSSPVRISGFDGNDDVVAGDSDIVLASVTLQGIGEGTANIDLNVIRVDDDSDTPIGPEVVSGTVTVMIGCPLLPGGTGHAQDLDNDGRCEDTNGNGRLDFHDIITLFEQISAQEVQDNMDNFDFNGNSRIGMADITSLFDMIVSIHLGQQQTP